MTLALGTIESLAVHGGAGNDQLTLNDMAGVNPMPVLTFNGDAGTADRVIVNGTSGPEVYAVDNSNAPRLTLQASSPTAITLKIGNGRVAGPERRR